MNRFTEIGEEILRASDLMWLDALKKLYEQGNRSALFDALSHCARRKMALPDWVAASLIEGVRKIRSLECKDWNEAFGPAFPPRTNLVALRKRREKQLPIWRRIRELHAQGLPVDEILFARVGAEFEIGGATVRDYYYDAKSRPEDFVG